MAKKSTATLAPAPYDDSKWRAEDDMRTLVRAEEVRRDPKRLAAAKKAAREKQDEMKKEAQIVADLAATKKA
jgi:hypothetical protein